MKAVEIKHCQAGAVTSRQDGSVKISFVTPELRPSEAGALIILHGKKCCVSIVPEDVPPEEKISVDTERGEKSPSLRLRSVLFVWFQQQRPEHTTFEPWYREKMETLIEHVKAKLQ